MKATLRLLALAGCMAAAFAAAPVFFLFPSKTKGRLQTLWSRASLAALGIRLAVEGEVPAAPALIVANHVSWLDVLAISSVSPAGFLCKQEIAAWPAIGWLLRRADVVFMKRGSAFAAWRAMKELGRRIESGAPMAVFPEGTTTLGDEVKPFFPAMLQAAIDTGCPVRPVAIAYADGSGSRSYACAYEGETSFVESLLVIASAASLTATISFLPELSAAALGGRKAAARHARAMIASRIRHAGVALPSSEEPMLRPA